MIAMTRDTLSVKDHSFAVCADCLPGITIGSRVKLGAPYSPLQERPGFSLVHPGVLEPRLRELRHNGVLRSFAQPQCNTHECST
jgi:hypothetical protein